jgi:hypothetical protein
MRQNYFKPKDSGIESLFADALEKNAVEEVKPEDYSSQIQSIMGKKSKYSSVAAAVEEMKARSGLTDYINQVKLSESKATRKKTASELPKIIQATPQIARTIENYISSTKGNMSITGIIERAKEIHRNDVANQAEWKDENLYRYVSQLNMQEKSKHFQNSVESNLGREDSLQESDFDQSNNDPFRGLVPAKI